MPVTSGMRFVRLISEEKLSETAEGVGQIKLRWREAISRGKTKDAARCDATSGRKKQKCHHLTRADFLRIVTYAEQHVSLNLRRKSRENRCGKGEVSEKLSHAQPCVLIKTRNAGPRALRKKCLVFV